ncbi:MAG: gamma-glutamylcyclotransferase family protein [Lentilitoribacter sp.]
MNKQIRQKLHEFAANEPIVGYFGYGSLVNENTLRTKYIASIPAELNNWQRMWDIPAGVQIIPETDALLTARPSSNATTKGVIVFDLAKNLPDVDEREHNYDRKTIDHSDINIAEEFCDLQCDFFVYEAHKRDDVPENKPPISQSYLDAVLQGFLNIYGEAGVEDFVASTANFHTPILQDRGTPRYPRSVSLSHRERELIDYFLRQNQDISFIS